MQLYSKIWRAAGEGFTKFLRGLLGIFHLRLISSASFEVLHKEAVRNQNFDFEFIQTLKPENANRLLPLFEKSNAQLRQDLMALSMNEFKEHGYFVEFGATDGIKLSNTYLLETEFKWTGILSEPAKVWHNSLANNRLNSVISHKCVWSSSGEFLEFNETAVPELSTVNLLSSLDSHDLSRQTGRTYTVETISLQDLLATNSAPDHIDYLSLDTEGSEYEILKSFL
jgi:FkbM family methyltransferase